VRLLHYSAKPFVLDRTHEYRVREGPEFKPIGLWVSVEGEHDWKDWCTSEGFGLERLAYTSEIVLRPEANVLFIRTLQELDRFDRDLGSNDPRELHAIDWARVRGLWEGIVIAPYQWERRMNLMWYYPWDCASGCIWNLHAIAEVKEVQPA